jgi:hypothetical protein
MEANEKRQKLETFLKDFDIEGKQHASNNLKNGPLKPHVCNFLVFL